MIQKGFDKTVPNPLDSLIFLRFNPPSPPRGFNSMCMCTNSSIWGPLKSHFYAIYFIVVENVEFVNDDKISQTRTERMRIKNVFLLLLLTLGRVTNARLTQEVAAWGRLE